MDEVGEKEAVFQVAVQDARSDAGIRAGLHGVEFTRRIAPGLPGDDAEQIWLTADDDAIDERRREAAGGLADFVIFVGVEGGLKGSGDGGQMLFGNH